MSFKYSEFRKINKWKIENQQSCQNSCASDVDIKEINEMI
jgi:hypothetical protein